MILPILNLDFWTESYASQIEYIIALEKETSTGSDPQIYRYSLVMNNDGFHKILVPATTDISIQSIIDYTDEAINKTALDEFLRYYLGFFEESLKINYKDSHFKLTCIDDDVQGKFIQFNDFKFPYDLKSYYGSSAYDSFEGGLEDCISDVSDLLDNFNDIFDLSGHLKFDNEVEDLTEYGDIADYLSLKTLVKEEEFLYYPPDDQNKPLVVDFESPDDATPVQILVDPSNDYIDEWDISQSDIKVYWRGPIWSRRGVRKIIEGDLLSLIIAYKAPLEPDEIEQFHINSNYGSEGLQAVRFNGQSLTFGSLGEKTINLQLLVKNNQLMEIDPFKIIISDDSISLYPINQNITEYYIKYASKLN